MAAPMLSIAPISDLASLPKASPNLMPFHVDHNGPAPISTYFLVEAASEHHCVPTGPNHRNGQLRLVLHVATPPPSATASAQESEMVVDSEEPLGHSPDVQTALPALPVNDTLSKRVTDATTRFIATFRGRTMLGLKVELPAGYAGVIVAGDSAAGTGKTSALKTKLKQGTKAAKARGNRVGRATRSAMRDDDNDDEMDGDEETGEDDQKNARTLMPTAQFSSFVLWHPDIPVDPGRDEYSLNGFD
ncbi:ribonuclease H2, subunit C [Mycena epipterygia]|nr:ribonuclease H2, subunit C [Mycena epipterygia]